MKNLLVPSDPRMGDEQEDELAGSSAAATVLRAIASPVEWIAEQIMRAQLAGGK